MDSYQVNTGQRPHTWHCAIGGERVKAYHGRPDSSLSSFLPTVAFTVLSLKTQGILPRGISFHLGRPFFLAFHQMFLLGMINFYIFRCIIWNVFFSCK
jgi:hypothetical protein